MSTAYVPDGTLNDLVPGVRDLFDGLIEQAKALGMNPRIRNVGRTCEQQQQMVKLGYSHADLCRGMHVFGHAVDLTLYPDQCSTYQRLGEIWEAAGGVWGGRWKEFGGCGDAGHFHYWKGQPQQAVPTSLCPSGVTLKQCQAIRERYLEAAFSPWKTWAKAGILGLIGVGAFVVVWKAS